jgi:hypothetical protein
MRHAKRYSPKYVPASLSPADRRRQIASLRDGTARPRLASFRSKRSKWIVEFERRFGRKLDADGLRFIDKYLLAKPGIDKILRKGRGAYYSSGSRPNQTAESWARARLAAVVVGRSKARAVDMAIWTQYRRRSDKLDTPFVSERKYKKYSVYVMCNGKRKLVHFGDHRYQQYKDKIGAFAALDHGDAKRRDNYYRRHGPSHDKCSAKYWSHRILW